MDFESVFGFAAVWSWLYHKPLVNLSTHLKAWEWIRLHLLTHLSILGRGHTPVIPDSGGGDWRKEEPYVSRLARAKYWKHKTNQNKTNHGFLPTGYWPPREPKLSFSPFWLLLLRSRGENRLCQQQCLGRYSSSLRNAMKALMAFVLDGPRGSNVEGSILKGSAANMSTTELWRSL